jgi:DNA-binding MarR family transcriptional regulator
MSPPDDPKRELGQGPLLEFVGYHIRLAQLFVYDDFMRSQPEPTLTPGQFAILVLIRDNPGLTQKLLGERIRVDKSTLTLTLDRLAARKLVRRVRSREDRRKNVLELTSEGEQQRRRMLAFVRRHERRILKNLSAAERTELVRLLDKMMRLPRSSR